VEKRAAPKFTMPTATAGALIVVDDQRLGSITIEPGAWLAILTATSC
jgi:hypothetical protein